MKKIFLFAVWLILGFLVIVNIYYSQNLDPLFFKLANAGKKDSALAFLKKIKHTTEFDKQMKVFEQIYGASFKEDFFADTVRRKDEINKLTAILSKNQKARDVLVKLSILYNEEENLQKAKEYYQKAKEIDPKITVPELEKHL